MLAHVFESLLRGINVLETENVIFEDAEAAVARINMDGPVTRRRAGSMRDGNPNIISLQLVAL